MPLAQAAAEALAFAQGHVLGMRYAAGRLSLTLAEGYRPPIDEAALARTAAAHGIRLERDAEQPHVWHVTRPDAADGVRRVAGARP